MKLHILPAVACSALLLNPLVFGSALPEARAYKLTVNPLRVVQWSQIVNADRLARTSTAGTFRVVPRPGRWQSPQPVTSVSPQPHEGVGPLSQPGAEGPGKGTSYALTSSILAVSFQALPDNNKVIPPDTYGAAGPNHLMTMLNSQVRIQDKSGSIISTVALSSFWSPLPSDTGAFDPRVQYDAIHGRWIASCGTNAESNKSKINFAISSTNDPTGTWTFYQLPADTLENGKSCWADYPCLGFNARWVVITANMFAVAGTGTFQGARMWAIDASSVVSGGAMSYKLFPTMFDATGGVNGFTLQPCVTYGAGDTLYLVDNSGFFSRIDTTFLVRLSRITGSAANPVWSPVPNSNFTGTGLFQVSNNYNVTQIDAAQLGTGTRISTNDFRLLNAVYRGGRIWCTHSGGLPAKITPAPTRTAVFWYQLNPLAMPSPIVQSGVLDGGVGVHHFFPSIAANANGDACLGFTRSDASRFAEAVFTGRLNTDPAGTMQTIQELKAGESSYSKFFGGSENRWGDYSNTCVDPSDDLTFWTIQEYAAQNVGTGVNDGRWGTWWGKVSPQSTSRAFVKLMLQGPFNSLTHLMQTTLKSSGILASHFASMLIPGLAVDSITIGIRSTTSGSEIDRPAWLLNDGTIRAFNDTTLAYVEFAVTPSDYYIVVRHRNHLAMMSATALALSSSSALYDFTTGQVKAFGTNPMVSLGGGVFGMFAGDVNGDGQLKYNLAGNDRALILTRIGGTNINATVAGYYNEDVSLDGVVKYNLAGNDRAIILQNIGGSNINASVSTQVPN